MTLKIWSKSPKSNQLVPPSQQCICASLVKIRPSVQKITCGNEATRTLTQTPTGSAPKTICPPTSVEGHNFTLVTALDCRKSLFLTLWRQLLLQSLSNHSEIKQDIKYKMEIQQYWTFFNPALLAFERSKKSIFIIMYARTRLNFRTTGPLVLLTFHNPVNNRVMSSLSVT